MNSSTSAGAPPHSAGRDARSRDWSSNMDALGIAAFLREARSVAIVTHSKPDGDAMGSTLCLARSLQTIGVDVRIVLMGPIPRWVVEVCGDTPVTLLPAVGPDGAPKDPWPGEPPEAIAIVDTGSWTQLAEIKTWLKPLTSRACVIDHHLHGDPDVASRRLIRVSAASCTEVLAPVCAALLGLPTSRFPLAVSEAIYLGLATDTGWFRYSSVTHETLRLAADMLQAGVDHTNLYRLIEQQDQAQRWRLLGRALNSLEIVNGGVAVMTLTCADFADTGADRNDTSGFADMALTIAAVELSVVVTEQSVGQGQPPLTKFSFRSKPGPHAVDVNALAARLGGGGHARAAGAKLHLALDQAKARMLEAIGQIAGHKPNA